jgi:predicted CopG family antitoxin
VTNPLTVPKTPCPIQQPRSTSNGIVRLFGQYKFGDFDHDTQFVYCLCMATKTISIETDAYELLAQEKKDRTESFSRVIRRLFAERPALTAGDLLDVMQEFKGKGAGPRRKRR